MGSAGSGSCGLLAAGRGTASAVGAAASGLALGAGGEHLQGYWIKPQLNEETKYGAGTNAVNMNYFKQAFAKPPQGPFYCFRIGIPLPALFVRDIHTGKMQCKYSGSELQLTLLPCLVWEFVLLH